MDSSSIEQPKRKKFKESHPIDDSNTNLQKSEALDKERKDDFLEAASTVPPFLLASEPQGRASGGLEAANLQQSNKILHVIDEVNDDDTAGDYDANHDNEASVSSDSLSYASEEVPDQEIDDLLEEGLPEEMKGTSRTKKGKDGQELDPALENVVVRPKIVLVDKPSNHFEVLPAGWVEVTHDSGMPVYLHRDSRVCTFSRPYWLGADSLRRHLVPISAIPCLRVMRDMEEKKNQNLNLDNGQDITSSTDSSHPIQESSQFQSEVEQSSCSQSVNSTCPFANISDIQNEILDKEECPATNTMQSNESSQADEVSQPHASTTSDDTSEQMASDRTDESSPSSQSDNLTQSVLPHAPENKDNNAVVKSVPRSLPLKGPLADALIAQSHLAKEYSPPKKLPEVAKDVNVVTSVVVNEGLSISPLDLNEYFKKRFKFRTVKTMRFGGWAEKRRYNKNKVREARKRPQLAEGVKLISLSKIDDRNSKDGLKKEWVINPKGKSDLCIMHEYIQHALKTQPVYEYRETDNAAAPYAATLLISDMAYSTGYGCSKKAAKMEAAKNGMAILLPDFKLSEAELKQSTDLSYFDALSIEDSRIPELCEKASERTPVSILLECLQRNFGMSPAMAEQSIIVKLVRVDNRKNQYHMTVGKHSVVVQCKNKKDGKQKAAQTILKKLHPFINSWGSLLRLYGTLSQQKLRERKMEELQVTNLQSKAELNKPNFAIIKKLKEEMIKLHKLKATMQPIKQFIPPEDISMPTKHCSELNNIDL